MSEQDKSHAPRRAVLTPDELRSLMPGVLTSGRSQAENLADMLGLQSARHVRRLLAGDAPFHKGLALDLAAAMHLRALEFSACAFTLRHKAGEPDGVLPGDIEGALRRVIKVATGLSSQSDALALSEPLSELVTAIRLQLEAELDDEEGD